jgi:hypothetical protein
MRARMVASGLGVLLAVGCGSVPDLRFGDLDDASVVSVVDSSLPSTPGEAGPDGATHPSEDASIADGSLPVDSGETAGNDAATPVCPTNPPKGAQCCGAILCRPPGGIGPGASFCNCMLCPSSCASDGVCCMNHLGGFESCATSIASCPAP